MKKTAIAITDGILHTNYAKTTHGLIRGTDRFDLLAVIDGNHAGKDAGEVLDGQKRGIPVLASISEAVKQFNKIDCLIVGVATKGGVLSDSLLISIREAIGSNLSIVNGLHHLLCEQQDIVELAKRHNVDLIDIRKPKHISELNFWTGEIFDVDIPIVAVLGMDCALGKRTTARLMLEACQEEGLRAEMIYTGQTGWMQGGDYGFIFDSTLNDFVSGELEHAIVSCWKKEKPDMIFLEGQSSLRNPSGPCGLEMIISGNARKVVLLYAPAREYFNDEPHWGKMPSAESEIEIIQKFGGEVVGLALNTEGLTSEEVEEWKTNLERSLNIPVVVPIVDGASRLIQAVKS
ncbi:MAG: DUF1611 domain-containing protein [Cyclobacteriaceae bacterium]